MSGGRLLNYKEDKDALLKYIVNTDRKPEETIQVFDDWAKDFEEDVMADGYYGPATFAEEFDKLGIPKDSKILEVCCGTGLFGKLLKSKGYVNIHGLDGSRKMLNMAKSQNVYHSYELRILTEGTKSSFSGDTFDVTLCCGAIGPGHLGADAFPELIRVTKSGGIVGWMGSRFKPWVEDSAKDEEYWKNFYQRVAMFVDENKWKIYKERIDFKNMYQEEPGFIQFMQVVKLS